MNIPEGWPTEEFLNKAYGLQIEDWHQVKKLIETLRYIIGIAEKGEGRKCEDSESPEQFVLNYVKKLEAALAAAPTPPEQSHHGLDDADIRAIALDCGFKLKPQPDGWEDLNPYVYKFARELLSTIPRSEDVAALREQLTPPAQEDEPIFHTNNVCLISEWMGEVVVRREKDSQHNIPLYTRPDNSGLRKAAKELLKQLDWACDIKFSGHENSKAYYKAARELRVALEGK